MVELEYPKSLVDTTSILADQGVPGCPRCGGKVRSVIELEYPNCRDINVFIFFKRSFRYENDKEKSKTKRFFLKTIVF